RRLVNDMTGNRDGDDLLLAGVDAVLNHLVRSGHGHNRCRRACGLGLRRCRKRHRSAGRTIRSPSIVSVEAGTVTVRSGSVTVVVAPAGMVTTVLVAGTVTVVAGSTIFSVSVFTSVTAGIVIAGPGSMIAAGTVVTLRRPVGWWQPFASSSTP